jgi:CUG-BP- and ETR3-like factor
MAETKEESKSNEESVKLFVGQVPKHMTEDELLTLFKEFAIVDEVNIIKDKATRASRGSFFFSSSNLAFSAFFKSISSHSLFQP